MTKTHEGKPCRGCEGTERYTRKDYPCVSCSKARDKKYVDNRGLERARRKAQYEANRGSRKAKTPPRH